MFDAHIRRSYRTCPCFSYDVEGIQSWLEDLAAQGYVLEADGTFCGIFTFQLTQPQKLRYRLAPVKQTGGIFSDNTDGPDPEEQEYSRRCGWEYLVRYGAFHIYRATDAQARPLHTDPTVHAMALEEARKHQWHTLTFLITQLLIHVLLTHNLFSFFRTGAVMGLGVLAGVLIFCAWLLADTFRAFLWLGRYQKRLRMGDTLDAPVDWKRKALPVRCAKLLPLGAVLLFLVSLGISLNATTQKTPIAAYPGNPSFAVVEDVFPGAQVAHTDSFGDYNTYVHAATALSENWEWNETADVTDGTGSYYCILRINHHETAGELWAKGLFRDYYLYERLRYRGKRFEELEAPDTRFDQVRVFSSYGILHVLIRQGSTVTHAVVTISQQGQNNHWQLWLDAMDSISP